MTFIRVPLQHLILGRCLSLYISISPVLILPGDLLQYLSLLTKSMKRLRLTKIPVIAALGIVSILYFSWIFPTLHVKSRLVKTWAGTTRRIVVFGDSFSDTGVYLIDPPKEDDRPIRDPEAGQRWTESLCEEVCQCSRGALLTSCTDRI